MRPINRRQASQLIAGALGAAAFAGPLRAQSAYPNRPVRLIVPYPAGGGTDAFARIISERLRQDLGQPILIDNKPGAGTMIAAEQVARSAPDGYTVLLGDTGTYAVNRSLYKKMPYDVEKDFSPVTLTARFALMLVVHPSMPVHSVQELIALAKAQPGQINFASVGTGSPHHLAMELFKQQTGVNLAHIPYRGGAPAINDLLPGRVAVMFLDVISGSQHVNTGKLRVLGVASPQRLSYLPGVPTLSESGLPGFEAWAWQGFAVPAGTPAAVIERLNKAYANAAADPAIQRRVAEMGTELIPSTAPQLASHIQAESAKWARVIHDGNITVD